MSELKLCSATETQNAKNILLLAELLCSKGVLNERELAEIFAPKLKVKSNTIGEKFPLHLLKETVGDVDESPEIIFANEQKIYEFMNENSIPGQIIGSISSMKFCRYEISVEPETDMVIFSQLQEEICRLLNVNKVRIFYSDDNHICLEVPHTSKQSVNIQKIFESEEWKNAGAEIPLAIGENVSGEPVILDLDQIRNLLIIGTVGNGKRTLLNSVVLSLLYRFSPDELQLLMYAPEQAISGICSSLPHLLHPPMTSPEEVRETFEELVEEIKRRNRIIADAGMDDLTEYNAFVSPKDKIPRIVFIIDDLSDEMRYGRVITKTGIFQIDNNLIRIVKKGCDVGIYLILGGSASEYIGYVIEKLFPNELNCGIIQAIPNTNKLIGVDILARTSKNKRPEKIHAALTANCDMRKIVEFISEQDRV